MEAVFRSDELGVGDVRVVKRDGQQVAVFRLADGALAAVDNRCPHEGYPLSQGTCAGATLTCCYHNFKFDLRSGACLKGDEAVRVVAVSEANGEVQLDLSPPDPGPALAKARTSFRRALYEARLGQALRDAARRVNLGDDPTELLAELAEEDGERSEWGATHVLAVTADLLKVLPQLPIIEALALPVEMVCENHVRRPARKKAEPLAVPADFGRALADAVEGEELDVAEGLVRGALAAGLGREVLEPALLRPVAAHFLDFGHAAIYQAKVFDLLDDVGWDHAPGILAGHVVGIVNGTREDTLPGWRRFREQMDAATPRFEGWWTGTGSVGGGLVDRLAEVSGREAVSVVVAALDDGAAPAEVAKALILAASERVLRFDVAIDQNRGVQDEWLSVTHCLTFAEAVHTLLGRGTDPVVLRLLLMAARMVGQHRVLDGLRPAWTERGWDSSAFAEALSVRDSDAMGFVADGLRTDPVEVCRVALDVALGERFTRPIVVAHAVKLVLAAEAAWRLTGDPRPVQSAVRLLVAPVVERRARRTAAEAVALVEYGQVPKLLAP